VVQAMSNAMGMVGRAGRIVLVKARADESIVHAVDGAARMLALIEELLTYSRVGRSADTRQPIDCGQIVDHALRSLSVVIEESGAHVLLVEDSPADVMMTREALDYCKVLNPLHVVEDGVEEMQYLRRAGKYSAAPRHGLIILDLNLPRKSGRELLQDVKTDQDLMNIPVVLLTTSKSEEDVARSYGLHANFHITKPVDFTRFVGVVRSISEFWHGVVTLPLIRS
jgi:CheY-like chemotaxis protein